MRRLTVLLALSLLAFAGAAAAGVRGGPPPFPRLPGTWSHAEINVRIKRQPHTEIVDRGKIVQASETQITLLESDGTTAVVAVDGNTIITFGRRKLDPSRLRRGLYAETLVIDAGPAVRVKLTRRP